MHMTSSQVGLMSSDSSSVGLIQEEEEITPNHEGVSYMLNGINDRCDGQVGDDPLVTFVLNNKSPCSPPPPRQTSSTLNNGMANGTVQCNGTVNECVQPVKHPNSSSNLSPMTMKIEPRGEGPRVLLDDHDNLLEDVLFSSSFQALKDGVHIRKGGGSCWHRRTCLERALMAISLLLLIALLLSLCTPYLLGGARNVYKVVVTPNDEEHKVCTTKACVEASSNFLSSVNEDVDPCDDFYDYACSRWRDEHMIPDELLLHGTFSEVRQRVDQQMRALLEHKDHRHNSSAISKTSIFYDKCMDRDSINAAKSYPLLDMFHTIGPWPIIQHPSFAMNSSWTMQQTMLNSLRVIGLANLYVSTVHADAKDTNRSILNIDQGELLMGRGLREYYLNTTLYAEQMHTVKIYMRDVLRIIHIDLNVTVDEALLWSSVDEILKFERKFAAIITPLDQRRDPQNQYHIVTIGEMNSLCPQFDWLHIFRAQATAEVYDYWTLETEVNVAEPDYFRRLSRLLAEHDTKVIVDYLMWRLAHTISKSVDGRFDAARQDYLRAMFGQGRQANRWKECTAKTTSVLHHSAGSLYVRRHFEAEDKDAALVMIAHLTASFKEIINELDWMDGETKLKAMVKVDGIRNHIGYPDFLLNNTALDEYYKDLHFTTEKTYFELFEAYLTWVRLNEYNRLLKPYDKDEFETSPAEVNAFYSPEKNSITFPAGILQPPFFNSGYPKSVNYGAIGAVIGHEITHGFDDQGSHFDVDGNMRNWWSDHAREGFEKRKDCIIKQYSNYVMPGINMSINGVLTQGENIADNGGVKEAFRAYRHYVAELGHEEARLPGFTHLSHNKLFFISYAHFWCSKKRPAFAVSQVLRDEHSPERFRVVGVLSNIDEFAREFKCAKGTRMNPLKTDHSKCDVW